MNQHEFWKDYITDEAAEDDDFIINPLLRQFISESDTETTPEVISEFNKQLTPPANPLLPFVAKAHAAHPLFASPMAAIAMGIDEGIVPDPKEIAKNIPGSFQRMGSGLLDLVSTFSTLGSIASPEARERHEEIRTGTRQLISETAKFAADLATSTPGDIVDPLQVTKDYPMLTAASQGIADTTPWGEGGWRGLVGRIEKDPAEWITDIALEATGAGIGYVAAKRGLKGTFDVLDKVLEAVPRPSAIQSRIAQAQTAQHQLYGGVAGGGTPSPKQLAKAEAELATLPKDNIKPIQSRESFIKSVDDDPNLFWRKTRATEDTLTHHSIDSVQNELYRKGRKSELTPDAYLGHFQGQKAIRREGVFAFDKYENTIQYNPALTETKIAQSDITDDFYDMRVIRGQKSADTKHLGKHGERDEVFIKPTKVEFRSPLYNFEDRTEFPILDTPPPKSKYSPTPEQAAVIAHREGYGRVAAGPGAGKTGTLAARVQSMTEEGIDPEGILTLAFNREAAREFTKRTGGEAPAKTLHAFSYEIIKERQAQLGRKTPRISNQDFATFMREQDDLTAINTYKSQGKFGKESMRLEKDKVSKITKEYETARQNITEGVFDVESLSEEARPYARAYEAQKRKRGEIDFQDSLIYAGQALDTDAQLRKTFQERYPYVQVDEFQDVSESDWRILKNLSPNLLGVGDIDQGIYGGLRGGTGDVMRRLEGNVGKTTFADYMKTVDEDPNLFVRAAHPSEDTLKQKSVDVPLTTGYHVTGMPDDFTLPKDAFWQSEPGTPSYEGSFQRGGTFGYKQTQDLYRSGYLDPYPNAVYGGSELRIARGQELQSHKWTETPEVVFKPEEITNKFNIDDFMGKESDVFVNEATGGILPSVQQYQLTQNFRSTPEIIAGSRQLIQRNPDRIDLDLQATRPSGIPIRQLRTKSGIGNAFDDSPQTYRAISTEIEPGQETAILTRTNEELRQMRTGLTQELGEQAFRPTQSDLTGAARLREITRLGTEALENVEFSTVHKAKGREWDKVLLKFNTEAGEANFPHIKGDFEEERRLAYVGMTRAKNELVMMGESHFIDEAQRSNWGRGNLETAERAPEAASKGFFQGLKDILSDKKTAGAIGIGTSAYLLNQDSEASTENRTENENRMMLPFGMSFSLDAFASQIYQKTPEPRSTQHDLTIGNESDMPNWANLNTSNVPGEVRQTNNGSTFRLPNINAEKSFRIPAYQTYTEGGLRSVEGRYQSTQARISPVDAIINSQFEGKAHQRSLEEKIEKLTEKQDELIDEVRESKHLTQAQQEEKITGIQERYGHLIGQKEWSLDNLREDQSIGGILKQTGVSILQQTGQKLLDEQVTQPATNWLTEQVGSLLGLGGGKTAAAAAAPSAATAAAPSAATTAASGSGFWSSAGSALAPFAAPLALAAGTFFIGEKSLDSGWDPDSVRFPEGTSHSQQVSEYHIGKRNWEKPAATEAPADKELWIVSQIESILRSVLSDSGNEISNQAVTTLGRKLDIQKGWGLLS